MQPNNTDISHEEQSTQTVTPAPIVDSTPWYRKITIRTLLPYLILSALAINILPGIVAAAYEPFAATAMQVRSTLNGAFIVVFVVIIILQLTGILKDAKN